ncbi:hypothetical protein K2173_026073 [Erythroxylum novogranatense]|uniref:Uncharacterized protein n=1 Tax=Erythroxylum novogranatense TaxID=1862640 RepID=A0AAV8SI38_9ROSI|nr:hypothetical protein K2173_026073 [Erythroxylum novogranatense]
MEDTPMLAFVGALKRASKELQINPIFTTTHRYQPSMDTFLELDTQAQALLPSNPKRSNLFKQFCELKSLLRKLRKLQGHSLSTLLQRYITSYKIYQIAFLIEAETQAYIDNEFMQKLVETLQHVSYEEEKVIILKEVEKRLLRGFDRDFQELVLKAKLFYILESLVCDSTRSKSIREHGATVIVALVRFNRDVFVGLVLMGPIVQALLSMDSCCSIKVLSSLVRLIRIPLIDQIELDGQIPRIISLLSEEDLPIKVATMECICEIAYHGRKEVIEAILEQGLIKKLVELQRSIHGDNLIDIHECNGSENIVDIDGGLQWDTDFNMKGQKTVENPPFASCVAKFSVQVEVGEGLSQKERTNLKLEIMRRIKECNVSEAEFATITAEVLWGSSP